MYGTPWNKAKKIKKSNDTNPVIDAQAFQIFFINFEISIQVLDFQDQQYIVMALYNIRIIDH